jgi:adenine-specific DNA-methyltransferase
MKGFVPTPAAMVDRMVELLFRERPPRPGDRLLDPGSGQGAFVDGVIRYCTGAGLPLPRIVAVESDPAHVRVLRGRFAGVANVIVRQTDFLAEPQEPFDYVVGNPPYVSIGGLTEGEKALYRQRFATASGRFDLYLLFFERALELLRDGGRLVFITPEKYLYVRTAEPLRRLLAARAVAALHFVPEDTFPDLVTYPLVTVVEAAPPRAHCTVTERDGTVRVIDGRLPATSWLPAIRQAPAPSGAPVFGDFPRRISCGVATGADGVFVLADRDVPAELRRFGYPTLSGREITGADAPVPRTTMLIPYAPDGSLLAEDALGPLADYLRAPARLERLLGRTCVRRKPWYAFHETPPLAEILRPKLLCKDIGADPVFVVDRDGRIVPRHSLYYIVPRDPAILDELAAFLNSAHAARWLRDHCQRAANGFLRLQSHVLRALPLPPELDPDGVQVPLPLVDAARRTA